MSKRLAVAMRAGAALRPQAIGVYFYWETSDVNGEPVSSCALGAVVEGSGWGYQMRALARLGNEYPEMYDRAAVCPACTGRGIVHRTDLFGIICHLNDDMKWTREQIADWLETLEEQTYLVMGEADKKSRFAPLLNAALQEATA